VRICLFYGSEMWRSYGIGMNYGSGDYKYYERGYYR
jgi:hypothetical protein